MLQSGDTVAVEKGEDVNEARHKNGLQNWSSNRLANTKWYSSSVCYIFYSDLSFRFAKICYMFEIRGKKMFHAQWYQHGAYTLLQETAHPQGLFLINECEDQPLECIYQKCNLQVLKARDDESLHHATKPYDLFSGFDFLLLRVLTMLILFYFLDYSILVARGMLLLLNP